MTDKPHEGKPPIHSLLPLLLVDGLSSPETVSILPYPVLLPESVIRGKYQPYRQYPGQLSDPLESAVRETF